MLDYWNAKRILKTNPKRMHMNPKRMHMNLKRMHLNPKRMHMNPKRMHMNLPPNITTTICKMKFV